MGSAAQPRMSPQQLNALQRQAVLSSSVSMMQSIYSATVNPATTPVLQIQPRNVGFIKRFKVYFSATVTNNDDANALSLTDFGLANFFSNIQFTDLNNNQRINTTGWHISFLNTIRHRKPFATGWTPLESTADLAAGVYADQMSKYGNNFTCVKAPATVVNGTPATIQGYFDIPLTYSDDDLRGGIYANVVNAVMQLQLTFNPTPFTSTGVDSTGSIYKSAGTADATLTNIKVNIYQEYLDQLPQGQGGVILPNLDVSTIYELKYSQFQNLPTGVDFPIQFANFRDFLSTFLVYNNNGASDSGRETGADINYLALQAANFTNFWKLDPTTQAALTREILSSDFPPGVYYQTYRRKPISTVQYGNVELVINPSVSTTASYCFAAWEDFALINTLSQAGSLASGG
jgi:P3 major capsid protein